MAKWFRSEPMEYISIIINEDASHDCLADLGKLGVIQFTDVCTMIGILIFSFLLLRAVLEAELASHSL